MEVLNYLHNYACKLQLDFVRVIIRSKNFITSISFSSKCYY